MARIDTAEPPSGPSALMTASGVVGGASAAPRFTMMAAATATTTVTRRMMTISSNANSNRLAPSMRHSIARHCRPDGPGV